jgi:hypothetical protein
MSDEVLDPELEKRLKLVENPAYEGESLTRSDQIWLFVTGIVIPFILMIWGWLV